ncbi:NAD(P)-binding protein [Periconia macrospinosa]|uniref:Short-chain dehydrogenase/reductase 3 n=1 Tax=Periconia macrospinosa TaxID=97972 RepID=A0A2V1D9Z1_9PLEO|nr:NAD(P)-binding protein [Periconia macrospinosa]
MPIRSEWTLAREGVTLDTFTRLVQLTALNPALTLPLVLLARYTARGSLLASQNDTTFKSLKTLLALGLVGTASKWLDRKVLNNWKGNKRGEWDWNKEVVVVTGGSDGIGKIIVQLFAEKGVKVGVLDVQELTYEAPPTVHFFKCDLADPQSIAAAAASLKSTIGDPTVLINNAGLARGKHILSATEFDIRLTFNVNTLSHYFLAQQFLPHMIARNHGQIVTVASQAAYVTAPKMVDYAASKAAALAFHEGLSAELSQVYNAPGVRTIIMAQGYTRTKLFEGFEGPGLFPETVAEEIVKAVLRGESAHLTLPVHGWPIIAGMRLLPGWIQYGVRKRLVSVMGGWKGRQVVQPTEVGGTKEGGVEESTVLVDAN